MEEHQPHHSRVQRCQKLHKHFLFLIFLILPTVSASSFTGSFNDYGKDAGVDGLFDYLTIEAAVNINNANKDYMLLGILEDSQGNLVEYNDCRPVTNTGIQNFILDFDGLKLYRNKVDGPYNLKYIELSSVDDCNGGGMPPDKEHYLTNAYITKAYQYTQFQKGDPAVYCNNSPCTASSTLIKSRDNINTKEPNAPNTIDGCEDGSHGNYLSSESIESITITSLNNNFFEIGDTVKIEIQVYCDSTYDKLNFVYTNNINNIQWKVKDNKQCSSTGLKTLSTTFALDNNVGQHAIRGVFGFNIQQNTICGEDDPQSNWIDNDDIVIYVKGCNSNNDCIATECDSLDKCYGGTFRDYHDMQNTCNQDFECTHNACSAYDEITTDNDNDSYDKECDNECNDNNKKINPGAAEICDNGIDDNCNTYIDNDDPECQGKYRIDLIKGWNLISLPKIENNSIDYIAANIFNNNFEKIVALKNNKWYIYDKSDLANSNLNELSEYNGFWIKLNNNLTLQINNEAAISIIFNLTKGWNLIGYPSMEQKDVNQLFQNVINDIELIYIYNNHFKSFNPQKPSNFIIRPGMGVFVKLKNNALWYFNGTYTKEKPQESFNLALSNGWNLISIPLVSDKTINEIFSSNKLYYLENNRWKQLNGNNQLNYKYAYWIKTGESSLLIEGDKINNLDYDINQGWNLINYPLTEEKNTNIFFQNVISNIESVKTFEDGEWKSFNPLKPNELNSLTILKPGKGIFVKAKNNAQWNFNGNEIVAT